jgi:hypothetical protein
MDCGKEISGCKEEMAEKARPLSVKVDMGKAMEMLKLA